MTLNPQPSTLNPRAGFTLVEMLVWVALVVLMMVMFAEIFQLAAGSVSTQRGLAENDQRARTVTIVMKSDLGNRTFRVVRPWAAGESTDAGVNLIRQAPSDGYFYISENATDDDTDDVLQFTAVISADDPFFGKATLLTDDVNGNGRLDEFQRNPDQPEADDFSLEENSTAQSTAAEICYFLRNGNLYRRVLLLRRPILGKPDQPQKEYRWDPTASGFRPLTPPQNFFDPANIDPLTTMPLYTGDFWNDFDFSAHASFDVAAATNSGAVFHGLSYLNNGSTDTFSTGPLTGTPIALGNPRTRFGHNHVDGMPREYVTRDAGPDATFNTADDIVPAFIGRFTQEETSSSGFRGYPQRQSSVGNPMDRTTVLRRQDGVVVEFFGGVRRAEDLLLPNVHSFDVKVWDERYNEDANGNSQLDPGEDKNRNGVLEVNGGFADVGHNAAAGDYQLSDRLYSGYGPYGSSGSGVNRVFDTWHPGYFGADGQPGVAGTDDDSNGTPDDVSEIGWPGSDDNPPFGPFGPDRAPGVTGVDDDGNGFTDFLDAGKTIPDPEEVGFAGSDDPPPLKAIQITIRFLDVSSGQLRQLTRVYSLKD